MPRRANLRGVRSHLVYTVPEAAETLDVHKETVRRWVRQEGLPATTDRKPWLIDGRDLKQFLESKQRAAKRPLALHEVYCFRCRGGRRPDGGLVDYRPKSSTHGMLSGLCPDCGTEMNRTIRGADLRKLPSNFEVAFPMAETGIPLPTPATVNVDLQQEPETHGKT